MNVNFVAKLFASKRPRQLVILSILLIFYINFIDISYQFYIDILLISSIQITGPRPLSLGKYIIFLTHKFLSCHDQNNIPESV